MSGMTIPLIYLTTLLVFLAVFLAVVAIYLLSRRKRSRLEKRIDDLSRRQTPRRPEPTSLMREHEPGMFGKVFVLFGGLFPQALAGDEARIRLLRAGFPWRDHLPVYVGLRFLSLLVGAAIGVVAAEALHWSPSYLVMMALVFGVAGYLIPDVYLFIRTDKRKQDIILGLPDALDLMVICVEAGLGLNAALLRVGQEIRSVCPPLSQELRLLNREMLAGIPRADALKNLAFRTGIDDVKALVAIVIQSEKLGTSIARSLRVHGDNLRVRRKHRAEAKARKVSVKLVFPLVFFIFPTLMVVILGPGLIQLIRALTSAQ
ncbi:MAG: type II secretion system F family protein [Candidatus Eisenbacteria bacterium]